MEDKKTVSFFAKISEEKWVKAIKDGSICFSPIDDFINEALNEGNDEQGDKYEGVFAKLKKGNRIIQEMRDFLGTDLEEIDEGDYILLRRYSARTIPVFCVYGFYEEDFKLEGEPIKREDGSLLIKASITISDKMYDSFLTTKKDDDVWVFGCSSDHLSKQIDKSLKEKGVEYRSSIVNYTTWERDEFFIEPDETYKELGYKRGKFSYQKEARFILFKTHQKSKFILPYIPISEHSCGVGKGKMRFVFSFIGVEKKQSNI